MDFLNIVFTTISSIALYQLFYYYRMNHFNLSNILFKIIKNTNYGKKYIDRKLNVAKDSISKELTLNINYNKYLSIPEIGLAENNIIEHLDNLQKNDCDWENGKAFGYIYHGGEEHFNLLNKVHEKFVQTNPLHTSAFKSIRILEAEVVRMTANMLNGNNSVCGCMTSGGTESIILAVKAARDFFLSKHPNRHPEMVCSYTIHAAFIKAANYLNIKTIFTNVDKDYKSDTKKFEKCITKNTFLLAISAPCYPFGIIDRVEQISLLAEKHNVWLHVDACLGGFILPWLTELNYNIPVFDFRLSGVSSMSCDIHKYGYSSKGSSVVLYKNAELRKFQYFCWSDWSGGLFASPSILGSRPGSSIAEAWTALVHLGKNNYKIIAQDLMETTHKLMNAIENIEELEVIGEPKACIFAVKSTTEHLDIFILGDTLEKKGWFIERQQKPNSLHFTITKRHVPIIDNFIQELKIAVNKSLNQIPTGTAAIYGNAVTITQKELVNEILIHYTGVLNDAVDNGGSLAE